MSYSAFIFLAGILSLIAFARGQNSGDSSYPSSWPHAYPGMPSSDYGPEWQKYFEVTESLPNVTWSLSRSWAGNIPVQRTGHPNNTLFFWAIESSNGSFTTNNTEPWGIWLNGGPGASSLVGLLFENGPIRISGNYSLSKNDHAWTTIADYVYIDQPVGTGWSTADSDGYAPDEDQVAVDFMGFLDNFIKVFPGLARRPLYITGESYAGKYIPYILKAYFEMHDPPVKMGAIAIGDGTMAGTRASIVLPVISVLETYPQIIGYDPEVFKYFKEQSDLCGYNLTLQYPQPEHFPTLDSPLPFTDTTSRLTKKRMTFDLQNRGSQSRNAGNPLSVHERLSARNIWKRNLTNRLNGTIDPYYLCDIYDEMIDYAINFTYPWSAGQLFDVYDIPDALSPEVPQDASVFLNDARTRAAIHAPTSKNWIEITQPVFAPTHGGVGDISPSPMTFLTDLATNATTHGVKIVIYSGNDDSILPHFGSQITIQNTTFGGIQGFTRKPSTPWYDDEGNFAGIVHQERNWTYVLIDHAGHLVPYKKPGSALVLAREFIFGNNQTGLVMKNSSGGVNVIGGENSSLLEGEILRGQPGIYYGPGTTAGSYLFPSATVNAWNKFIATAAPIPVVGSDD